MNKNPCFDYLWMDLEMSGLDEKYNRILQVACVLTDRKLELREEGPWYILACDEAHLKTMDEWNMSHHTASGLYKSCLQSQVSVRQAEQGILIFIKEKGIKPGHLVIAGTIQSTEVNTKYLQVRRVKCRQLHTH